MSETTTQGVALNRLDDGKLLQLVLDAGKGNVIDAAVIARLRELAKEVAGLSAARALIIDHTGKHFSFGASVADHVPGEVEKMLPALHGLARELLALDLPILCAVRGMCLGAGWRSPSWRTGSSARRGPPTVSRRSTSESSRRSARSS